MKKKSLKINFFYNAIYNGLNVLFPLLTIPYVSRILLSDGLGKVNFANNIITWFLLFASLGIPRYGVREIAKNRENNDNLNKTFSELFFINFISTLVSYITFIIMIMVIPYFEGRIILFLVVSIQLALNIFNVDWFYQGMEEYKYITNRSFIIKVLSLIAMFIFVKTKDDYIIYALIQSLAIAGNYCFNFIYLKKFVKIVFKNIEFSRHIKPILILLSTQLAVNIYSLLDTTMLGVWCSDSVVGYYSNVHKVIKTISVVSASLGSVMLPRFVVYIKDKNLDNLEGLFNKVLKIIILLCLPISIGLFMISKELVLIVFGNDFNPCIITMKIFSPFILFTTVGNLFGTQLMMAYGKEKQLLKTVIIGSIVNFCLNLILIKLLFEQNGVAFASVLTEFIVMSMQILCVKKIIKIKINKEFILKTIVSNILMLIIMLIIDITINNLYMSLSLKILFGILIYFISNLLLKNQTIMESLEIVKIKLEKRDL